MNNSQYLKNQWYVVGLSEEVTDRPFASSIMGEPIVIFRNSSSGEVAALEDRCVHRQAPLSLGVINGENLQCGYHGIEYNRDGNCVHIPSQKKIPPGAKIKSYPCRDHQGFIFVWMGDPAISATVEPYNFPYANRSNWRVRYARLYGRFDHRLLIDNLMDVTHLPFAHKSTIGASGVADRATVKTERMKNSVRVTRSMENIEPAPAHVSVTGYTGKVDRWQVIEFTPPGFIWLQVGSAKTGTGARKAKPENILLDRHTLHLAMPETDKTTLYFWMMANKAESLTTEQESKIYEASLHAFNEDITIIEGQQDRLRAETKEIDLRADTGVLEARRLLKRLAAEEVTL